MTNNPGISRRQLLVGGAGIAGAAVLAACGGSSPASGSGGSTQAKPSGSGGGSGGGSGATTDITYWHVNTATFGLPAVTAAVNGFNSSQTGVKVTPQFQQGVYTGLLANLQTALAAGKPPSVAQIGYLYSDYVKDNFPYTSITDLVKKYGPSDFLNQFPSTSLDIAKTTSGDQIGVPYAISNVVTYYNSDMLAKGKVTLDPMPKTWPEWRTLAETYKKATGQAMLYVQILNDNWTNTAFILSHGGALTKCDNGSVKAAFDSPNAVAAIQYWADLIKDGLCLNVPLDQGEQEFLASKVPVYMTTIGKRASFTSAANFTLSGTYWPSFPGFPVKLPAGGNELVVFAKTEPEQRAAWEFVKYLFTPKAMTAWILGTGYMPPNSGEVVTDPQYLGDYFKKFPIAEISEQQLKATTRWVYFPGPNGLEAGNKGFFSQGLEPALGGQQTAQQSLSAAAKTVNTAIAGQKCSG